MFIYHLNFREFLRIMMKVINQNNIYMKFIGQLYFIESCFITVLHQFYIHLYYKFYNIQVDQ